MAKSNKRATRMVRADTVEFYSKLGAGPRDHWKVANLTGVSRPGVIPGSRAFNC